MSSGAAEEEIPIRFAERVRWIEQVPEWEEIPELVEAHLKHTASFSYMRKAEPKDGVKFQGVVQKILKRQDNMVELMAVETWQEYAKVGLKRVFHDISIHSECSEAMQKLRKLRESRGEENFDNFSNKFLDDFLLSDLIWGIWS